MARQGTTRRTVSLCRKVWGRPLTDGLSAQTSILGPNPAQIQQGFNLHCMGNLMTCQIIMHEIEATLVLKNRKRKKKSVFAGTGIWALSSG